MNGVYRLEAPRTVYAADQNIYRVPALHPDRIMTEHDLVYMARGSWEIRQDGTPYLLRQGEVLLLHGGRHHDGVRPCEADTRTLYIHMSMDAADRVTPEAGAGEAVIPTLVSCAGYAGVPRLFEEIVTLFHTTGQSPTRDIRLSALCQLLLCELRDAAQAIPGRDEAVDRALNLIRQHPGRMLSGEELAAAAYVSERTLRNRFLRIYGKTPHQYQMERKLLGVRGMLTDFPHMPLREVAGNYGFCDEFHLSKAFKSFYGLSPAAYRRQMSARRP